MSKCFAFYECWKDGVHKMSCGVINNADFKKIYRKQGGCCMRNCSFYKEHRDQIRTEKDLKPMSQKQLEERVFYHKLNYKGI